VQNIRFEKFQVRAYEIDTAGKLSVPALCNYMQEIAGNHARELGVGFEAMLKQELIWVLSRLYLQIDDYPSWGESVEVETWPAAVEGKFALRDFLFHTTRETVFGRATTSWMVLDLHKRKSTALPELIQHINRPQRERALIDPFVKLPALPQVDLEKKYQVRLSDLDLNFHVNNVSYIKWALDSIPLPVIRSHRLHTLEISYRAESHIEENVLIQIQQSGGDKHADFTQCLIREKDNQELAMVRTRWRS
jgi:acyl-ACP thioesterase